MITRNTILHYLNNKKEELHKKYGIISLGLYGSYARDEATSLSDVDIFYVRDSTFDIQSGFDFMNINEQIANELNVGKVDFVSLNLMNPIIKHYAKKDFIYV